MNKYVLFIAGCFFTSLCAASSGQDYLDRFNTYLRLSTELPTEPSQEMIDFIKPNLPLSNKLRAKWLYQAAKAKNWAGFLQWYQDSPDPELQCYAGLAQYHSGHENQAFKLAKQRWLSGNSQPPACDTLFSLFLKSHQINDALITQRIMLALDQRNLQLARYLLKQYQTPRPDEAIRLMQIYQNPASIVKLEANDLHQAFYLYGLKRMVSVNMDQAIKFWQHVKKKKFLNEARQQAFLAHVALYKAMRNQDDAAQWFAQVKPAYYNDVLLDWQIRYALKRQQWAKVQRLINLSKDKDSPCWQYWLARALEAQGKKEQATKLYEQLATTRHYYGFLASIRLKRPLHFSDEKVIDNPDVLSLYKPILDKIRYFYDRGDDGQASRLLNDFISELPKDEASALTWWVATELQWPDKSIYLSNTELLNNQLGLRFPLAYEQEIKSYAKNNRIPPEFVYAIIRQESSFRENATSSAGAMGLMQVMPRTAKMVAQRNKIAYQDQKQLFVSQKNLMIGIGYLQHLAKQFNNHPALMAAAYNAGPHQVNFWLRNHRPKAIDIWIETLPWHETRNYLKNVIAFFAVYQYRMQQKPDLQPFLQPL